MGCGTEAALGDANDDELALGWWSSPRADCVVDLSISRRGDRLFEDADSDLRPSDFALPGDSAFWRLHCAKPYPLYIN